MLIGAAAAATDAVDDYLTAEMRARGIPGLALAVVRHGSIARTSYYGMADVELDAPVGEPSVFAIASLDKEITAAGVMRLVERGRIALDDRLGKYVDGPWGAIAVRHLLTHTSGLPDQVAGSIEGRSGGPTQIVTTFNQSIQRVTGACAGVTAHLLGTLFCGAVLSSCGEHMY